MQASNTWTEYIAHKYYERNVKTIGSWPGLLSARTKRHSRALLTKFTSYKINKMLQFNVRYESAVHRAPINNLACMQKAEIK